MADRQEVNTSQPPERNSGGVKGTNKMPTQIITETLPPLAWVDWALPLAALVVIVVAGGIGLYAEWRKENGK